MALKPVVERSIKVELTIIEKREGAYSVENVGSTSIAIPLPAAEAVGLMVENAVGRLVKNAETFRGSVTIVEV